MLVLIWIRFGTNLNYFAEQIRDSIDVLMISKTKFGDSFPLWKFLIEGFSSPCRGDRDSQETIKPLLSSNCIPKLVQVDYFFHT